MDPCLKRTLLLCPTLSVHMHPTSRMAINFWWQSNWTTKLGQMKKFWNIQSCKKILLDQVRSSSFLILMSDLRTQNSHLSRMLRRTQSIKQETVRTNQVFNPMTKANHINTPRSWFQASGMSSPWRYLYPECKISLSTTPYT